MLKERGVQYDIAYMSLTAFDGILEFQPHASGGIILSYQLVY
jgi:hypothetical protein